MPKKPNPLSRDGGVSINFVLSSIVALVAVCVIGGVLLFNGGSQNGGASASPAESLRKPDSHVLTDAPGEKVEVVEFLDYQCPSCASYYENLTKQVEKDYGGRIDFVVRNFPLGVHALAESAAQAAEAAAMQGKYQHMYKALFEHYESWAVAPDGQNLSQDEQRGRERFDQFARQIGLDLDRFHRDMVSPRVSERITQDTADGEKAGVSGTPTLFVNGKQFEPRGRTVQDTASQFRAVVDKELAR